MFNYDFVMHLWNNRVGMSTVHTVSAGSTHPDPFIAVLKKGSVRKKFLTKRQIENKSEQLLLSRFCSI